MYVALAYVCLLSAHRHLDAETHIGCNTFKLLLKEMHGLFYVFQSLRVIHTIKVYFSGRL